MNAPELKPDSGRKLFYGLFIFPLVILAGMIVMVLTAVLLTHEKETPESLLTAIKTGSERKRWQKASELSNELNRLPRGYRDAALGREIVAMLGDSKTYDAKTRAYLAVALGHFDGQPEAEAALRRALDDADPEVQFYAIWTLGLVGARSAAPEILPFLKSDRSELRVNAAYVLGALGAREAVPALRPLVEDPVDDVRWNAALALARLGDASGLTVLTRMTDRRELETSRRMAEPEIENLMTNAIKGLALIPGPESIKILQTLAREDRNLRVRQAAMDAMQFQKKPDSGKIEN
ncbi:MAG TPA: HEAT repeat domain-containing protein [Candidatus Eisenbacteria bacterium]|nr:HEAT repeat domain-containing protein [Candidatus Eisenbacteria bacterium]